MNELLSGLKRYLRHCASLSLGLNLLYLAPTMYTLLVFDRVLTSRSIATLSVLTIGAVAALLIGWVLDLLRGRMLGLVGLRIERQLGPKVIEGLLAQAVRSADVDFGQALRDVATVRGFLAGAGVQALFDAPWLPLYLIVMFLFHPVLGICALFATLSLIGLTLYSNRRSKPMIDASAEQSRLAQRYLEAGLRNAEVVNVMGMRSALTQRWQLRSQRALDAQRDLSRSQSALLALGKMIRQVLQLLTMGVAAWLVVQDNVAPGVMMAATVILGRVLQPLESILAGWRSLVEVRSAQARLEKLAVHVDPASQRTELPAPTGALSVDRVSYAAGPGKPAILKNVSLALKAGEALAVIGPSGAGKSTLARVVVGLWRPQGGVVRLDGADLALWPRADLGPHLGYVPQDVELFGGTVAENIARLGEVDSEQVIRAARRAGAHELILALPQGYDTPIADGGLLVSAGQRQRIALARALYGNPRLIVLDEPNSNLDTDGENALMAAMRSLREDGVTQVIITHRPLLLSAVDKVLLLRDGGVELFGPRDEVLNRVMRPVAPAVENRAIGAG
jgi:ATP-binding cassette subfamily C exporter for protease/lipase/ATP-binding cassette subfamily C protein EexD